MTAESLRPKPDSNVQQKDLPRQNAALRGASMAFGKPAIAPKPLLPTPTSSNGALAAAARAGQGSPGSRPLSAALTGSQTGTNHREARQTAVGIGKGNPGAATEIGLVGQGFNQVAKAGKARLQLPVGQADRARSPSHIAASLAASRSAPTSPNLTGQPPVQSPFVNRKQGFSTQSPVSKITSTQSTLVNAPDTTSIPPTKSVVGMFERTRDTTSPAPTTLLPKTISKSSSPPGIQSPKPKRAPSLLLKPEDTLKSPEHTDLRVEKISDISNIKNARKPLIVPDNEKDSDTSSGESFVSAKDRQPPSPPRQRRRPALQSSTSRSPTSDDAAAIDAMANAIVASSLATSRAASPAKSSISRSSLELPRPNPPPRRRTPSIFHLHQSHQPVQDMRTPSPAKQMRTTMRKPRNDDDEEDINLQRTTRRNIIKKHPNKHHEGDRKRWRDSVTERERKRYEAVWASNKGRYLSGTNDSMGPDFASVTRHTSGTSVQTKPSSHIADGVCNIVVRDIWARSRLGKDILSEVWDLVDRSGRGYLCREEFVAGMWLIDQRLKGRKLPIRVGDSVWASVSALGGVRVKAGKKGR